MFNFLQHIELEKAYIYCTSVKVSCGNGVLSPSCNLCPQSNDTELKSWCRGTCYFDERDEICKEGNILLLLIPLSRVKNKIIM